MGVLCHVCCKDCENERLPPAAGHGAVGPQRVHAPRPQARHHSHRWVQKYPVCGSARFEGPTLRETRLSQAPLARASAAHASAAHASAAHASAAHASGCVWAARLISCHAVATQAACRCVCSTAHLPASSQHALLCSSGLHTGDCVSGLVGIQLPKFSLFGERLQRLRLACLAEPAIGVRCAQRWPVMNCQSVRTKAHSVECKVFCAGPIVVLGPLQQRNDNLFLAPNTGLKHGQTR